MAVKFLSVRFSDGWLKFALDYTLSPTLVSAGARHAHDPEVIHGLVSLVSASLTRAFQSAS